MELHAGRQQRHGPGAELRCHAARAGDGRLGRRHERQVDITINGANDAAVITGTVTGAVTEKGGVANGTAGVATATGTLSATDVDSSARSWCRAAVAKTYGTFSIDAAGAWSYTLDDNNAAVQALNAGDTLHELVTVATADGTTRQIDITINGANDTAVIETAGVTDLVQVGNRYFLHDSGGAGPSLKYLGAAVAPGQFGELDAYRRREDGGRLPSRVEVRQRRPVPGVERRQQR